MVVTLCEPVGRIRCAGNAETRQSDGLARGLRFVGCVLMLLLLAPPGGLVGRPKMVLGNDDNIPCVRHNGEWLCGCDEHTTDPAQETDWWADLTPEGAKYAYV